MSTEKLPKRSELPVCSILRSLQGLHEHVLTPCEFDAFNAFSFFQDLDKTAAFTHNYMNVLSRILCRAIHKLHFLQSISDRQRFMSGRLTQDEALRAPLVVHRFSPRLHNKLTDIGHQCLSDVLLAGEKVLENKKGIGPVCLEELNRTLDRYKFEFVTEPILPKQSIPERFKPLERFGRSVATKVLYPYRRSGGRGTPDDQWPRRH